MLFEFESTFLLEHPWKLSAKDAALSGSYNPLQRPTGKAGMLDVGTKGEVQTSVLQETAPARIVSPRCTSRFLRWVVRATGR